MSGAINPVRSAGNDVHTPASEFAREFGRDVFAITGGSARTDDRDETRDVRHEGMIVAGAPEGDRGVDAERRERGRPSRVIRCQQDEAALLGVVDDALDLGISHSWTQSRAPELTRGLIDGVR